MSGAVQVEQVDRDCLAEIVESMGLLSSLTAEHIRRGGYDGDCALLARHRLATAQREREEAYERCARICEEQQKIFSSSEYAAGQPMSSFGERFACGKCAEEIRQAKGGTNAD